VLRVGLTGGIASGKSQVLARLGELGATTLDLDRVAHDVMGPGAPAFADVVAAFGPGILGADGAIDRSRLGPIVFGDAAARQRLNALVHPRVREAEVAHMAAAEDRGDAVFVSDAALLVETGTHLRYDRLVVVWCEPAEQLRRLRARDGLDERAARARLAAQMPVARKRLFANVEIDAQGGIEDTLALADRAFRHLAALAEVPLPRPGVRGDVAALLSSGAPAVGPRGLTPAKLAAHLADRPYLEMAPLAALLQPPAAGPWYEAAREHEAGPGPENLAVPLALFVLERHGVDPDYLASAAASLARLTHRDEAAVTAAVKAARAAAERLLER
jgi:dephospho-CoA kinase